MIFFSNAHMQMQMKRDVLIAHKELQWARLEMVGVKRKFGDLTPWTPEDDTLVVERNKRPKTAKPTTIAPAAIIEEYVLVPYHSYGLCLIVIPPQSTTCHRAFTYTDASGCCRRRTTARCAHSLQPPNRRAGQSYRLRARTATGRRTRLGRRARRHMATYAASQARAHRGSQTGRLFRRFGTSACEEVAYGTRWEVASGPYRCTAARGDREEFESVDVHFVVG